MLVTMFFAGLFMVAVIAGFTRKPGGRTPG